jgi:two-component system chemotaxis sensor kinase CheA
MPGLHRSGVTKMRKGRLRTAMENNANQFREVFREEARETVAALEADLLELLDRPDDAELVGRIFRGLHTIKGSGAMFGFQRLSGFTHRLENAFDGVRSRRISVSQDLVDITLKALDHIRAEVEEGSDGGKETGAREQLLNRLEAITREVPEAPAAEVESIAAESWRGEKTPLQSWRIRFAPGPELLRNGSDPLLLVRELSQLGDLQVTAEMDAIPPLAEMDPERCYVAWSMDLRTRAPIEAVRDVFIFVEDCCQLRIEPAVPAPAPACPADGVLEEKRTPRGGRRVSDMPDTASSLRVAATKLDELVNLVGELVTVQARLSELAARRDDPEVSAVAEDVERLSTSLREISMNMRMMPIRGTFEKFRRLVHDLSRDLKKNVEMTITGADTELDKTIIDQLSDPLMHLIRNSMDHGIDSTPERIACGKPPVANIRLSARYSGASVLIAVADDGRGIDAQAVRSRAIEKGLIGADSPLGDDEIHALIFQPGFSTSKQVTDISGRGVGMDVVRKSVDRLRGSIDVSSAPGKGTTVTMRLPLTLAIIDGLLVTVDSSYFVLPLANTLECIELTRQEIDRAEGKRLINVRGEIVPYIRLREHFAVATPAPAFEQIMLVDTEAGRYGLMVDHVLGNCQTMIKSLGRIYRRVEAVSGATILGNGTVALILDPHRLVQQCVRASQPAVRGHPRAAPGARIDARTEASLPDW